MARPLDVGVGLLLVLAVGGVDPVRAQDISLRGEASISGILSDGSEVDRQLLGRYLPEMSLGLALPHDFRLAVSLSPNLWLSRSSGLDGVRTDHGLDAYRAWVRLSTPRFEIRGGLQKVSFGSASVFRPLMWFDRVDPRDPLQLTEGVWGVLSRAYLPGNLTLWGWALRGEDKLKGWEVIPTLDGSAEGGGRIQIPVGPGEWAITFHHRRFDMDAMGGFPSDLPSTSGDEDRFAIDGKWDLEVGLWIEAVLTRQDSELLEKEWTRALNVGVDYTFGLGNGLTVLTEHIVQENPTFRGTPSSATPGDSEPVTPTARIPKPVSESRLTAFSAGYPVGVLDRFSVAVYRDWAGSSWFRLLEWRRTYDRWRIHLLGFWNPEAASVFPSHSGGDVSRSGSLGGRGAQLIVVFNH